MSITNMVGGVIPLSIYTVLKGEHNEVSLLFKTLEASPQALEEGRAAVFKKLRQELMSHAKAEEAEVYTKVRAKSSNATLIEDAQREHEGMVHLLDMIYSMHPATEMWMEQVKKLKEMVEHHVQEEETQTFEEMKRLFSDEEAKEMAQAFHEAKKREMEIRA